MRRGVSPTGITRLEALIMEKVMKNFALGLLVCCGLASTSFAQNCAPVYCCAFAPAPMMCCATFIGQETAPAAVPQEPTIVIEQSTIAPPADQSSVPSSVLISPAPEPAPMMESAPILGVPSVPSSGAVYSNNSRSYGGLNILRRRGAVMGRIMGRFR